MRTNYGTAGRLIGHVGTNDFFRGAIGWLHRLGQRARDRHALENLDAHLLQDIGLTRADVMKETTKSIWHD